MEYLELFNVALLPLLIYVRRMCKELDQVQATVTDVKASVKRLENLHLK